MGPLPLLALSFTAGIALGLVWPTPAWSAVVAASGAAVALGWALGSGRRLASAAITTALVAGWIRAPGPDHPLPAELDPEPCPRVLQGRVHAAPTVIEDRTRTIIELEGCSACLRGAGPAPMRPTAGTLFLSSMEPRRPPAERGDRVRVIATTRPIRERDNPPGPARAIGGRQWSAVVDRADALTRIEAAGPALRTAFDALRGDLADFWNRTLGPERARLARALTLGQASVLDPAQKERFRRTGTAHLLAVSGLHLGLVVLFAFGIARFLLVRVTRLSSRVDVGRIAALLAIPVAIGFALLAGGRPPVVRACAMVVCGLAGRALGRRAGAAEAVAIAGVGLLAWDPEELTRPGFQLSFAAVLSFLLVLKGSAADRGLEPRDEGASRSRITGLMARIGRSALGLLRASAAATAATTPLVLYHFDRVSLIGLPVNAIAVPVAAFTVMPGLLAATALAGPLPVLAELVAHPVGWILGALDSGLGALADLPCTLESPSPAVAAGVALACVALLAALARRYRPALLVGSAAALTVALGLVFTPPRFPPDRLTVDFLDVGQGDATLVTFPDGAQWLVDAGGNPTGAYDVGEHLVLPVLRALGVERLDTLVLTHPDPDHVGGMPAVASKLEVGRIWDNGQGAAEGAVEEYGRLLDLAAARGIPVQRTRAICGPHRVGVAEVAVLHPCHDEIGYDPGLSLNDNSIALRISLGAAAVLLTGDLGHEGERIAVAAGAIAPADVLKLGHHGSAGSTGSQLLEAVSPSVAIASCGFWNRHGMPHPSLVSALGRRRIDLLRTDLDGAVRVVTDGRIVEITPRRSR